MFTEKKMKIAIEANILSENINGIGKVIVEVANTLAKYNEVTLLLNGNINQTYEINKKVMIDNSLKINSKFFWFHLRLPYYFKKNSYDVAWFPSHKIPFLIPKKTKCLLTIHDLIWKKFPRFLKKKPFCLN